MDINGIQLRQATGDDAPLLLSILHAAFEEYRGRLDPPSGVHAETIDTVRQRLATACAVIALADEEPAGCVFYERQESHIYLGRLSVLPQYRQRGLGRVLIDYVEGEARRLGLSRVQLGVRIALPHLRAYYESLGYRKVGDGTHPGYEEPTWLVLEKDLA